MTLLHVYYIGRWRSHTDSLFGRILQPLTFIYFSLAHLRESNFCPEGWRLAHHYIFHGVLMCILHFVGEASQNVGSTASRKFCKNLRTRTKDTLGAVELIQWHFSKFLPPKTVQYCFTCLQVLREERCAEWRAPTTYSYIKYRWSG